MTNEEIGALFMQRAKVTKRHDELEDSLDRAGIALRNLINSGLWDLNEHDKDALARFPDIRTAVEDLRTASKEIEEIGRTLSNLEVKA